MFIDVDVKPLRKRVVDNQKIELEALHKGFQGDLTRKDAVFVRGSVFHLDTSNIFVRRKDPFDDSFSKGVSQRLRVNLKLFEYGFGNERAVDAISFFLWKSIDSCDGESHGLNI